MASRYFRVDVDFFHKRTCRTLASELGPWAPIVFLSLIARAKDGPVPGTFSYFSEAVALEKLGVEYADLGFTLDGFFKVTGRLKQTSRRRNGLVWDVCLTRYADWQKDSRRYEEAVRKSSKRRETAADTQRTQRGTRSGHNRGSSSSSISTPYPNGKSKTPRPKCHLCSYIATPDPDDLAGHLEDNHGIIQSAA